MILLYNTNATHNPNAYITRAVEAALRRLVGPDGVRRVDERTLARAAADGTCRLLVCIDGQRLDAGLLARIRPAVGRLVLWVFEDPFMLDYNLASLDLFDLVFTNDPSCVASYAGKGRYLPLGGDPGSQRRPVLQDRDLRFDLFFAGTMWPNRIAMLERIIAAFPNARLKLVCPTNIWLPPLPPEIANRAITRPISHDAFIEFANASRVTLTMFRDHSVKDGAIQDGPVHGVRDCATAPGPRLYELALAGTAQVVLGDPRMDPARLADLDGIVVAPEAELAPAIAGILEDPSRRHDLAVRAQESALAGHCYEHRLRLMLDTCLEALPDRRPAAAPASRLRVLVCTHSTMQDAVWGGIEVYQEMLATALQPDIETLYWIRRDESCQLLDAAGVVLERFAAPGIGWLDCLCDAIEETRFAGVLAAYAIDLVHFQHLGHHAASLPLIARAAGVGTLFSVHDFYLVCARYNLLDDTDRFCDIGTRSITACTVCLTAAEGLPPGVQQQRRAFMHLVLGAIDLLLFGSAQSEALLLRIYPATSSIRRLVIGVPAPAPAMPRLPPPVRAGSDDPRADVLGVAVIGNFLRSKGADTVLRVIEASRPDQFTFHILGMAGPEYIPALERLAARHVHHHGRHRPGDMQIPDAQVALHLSTWPETWCISLSEAWIAGMIPIVSDIGALGERVTHGRDGFKVRVGDAAAVLDLLDTLRRNPELRTRMVDTIGPHLWIETKDYARRLLGEYRRLAPALPLGCDTTRPLALDMRRLHLLPHENWKVLAPARSIQEAAPIGDVAVLQSPARITGWQSIQAARCYVDRLCGAETDPLQVVTAERRNLPGFRPSPGFSISGWVFLPGQSQAGQVTVCLIHQGGAHVIFLEAQRLPRADVQAGVAEATLQSGFSAAIALRGKWADGHYAIGIIVCINGAAGFHLSDTRMQLTDGCVVAIGRQGCEEDAVLRCFACVFASTPAVADPLLHTEAFAKRQRIV